MSAGPSQDTAYQPRATGGAADSGSGSFSPELQRDLNRRLAGVAVSYSGAYVLSYGTSAALMALNGQHEHSNLPHVIAVLSVLGGLAVFLAARRGRLPTRILGNVTVAFAVLGAVGIMGGAWGWERHFDLFNRHVWEAIGSPALAFPEGFVQRLLAARLRIVNLDGVTWVGVWLLVVPMFVPLSPRRTLLAVALTAATVPGVLGLSLAMHGTPPSVAPWVTDILLDATVPTFICAGLAFFGARTVYRITRDLSRAQQLGSYQLVERIGVGGMGEVWHARHQLLARPAAIKLIRPDMLAGAGGTATREVLRRFEREAQATANLRSPHTIELYDFGTGPDGTFYYVMELLDGFDFKTLVERFGVLEPARVIHLLRQACHSLEDAHRAGLVHRDVKPSNLFACRRGVDLDFVKVLDFGLVKSVGSQHETIDVSAVGVARGTPAFMSPEAVTGSAAVDGRSDLYALGCVAYWLLTGTLVFEGPTPLATLMKHVQDVPEPPSRRLGVPIPPGLEQTVLDCLQKDPAARPSTAAGFSARLGQCEASLDPWTDARAEAWWREHAPVAS